MVALATRSPSRSKASAPQAKNATVVLVRFAIAGWNIYIRSMPRKPLELPPAAARRFAQDMRAYFASLGPSTFPPFLTHLLK